jgi:hypothetical protein
MCNVSTVVVCRAPALTSAWTLASLFLFLSLAGPASAQTTDIVGVRAQGMAGAFTAVADDASAGFWNPAGLAGGPFANGTIEYGTPDRSTGERLRGFSAAYPAFGVSYYRLPVSEIRVRTSTAASEENRQDQGFLTLYGGTFGQSLGEHFVVGATVKLLHADDTRADLDAGVMATFGPVRLGATLRNVSAPTFGDGAGAFTLPRHGRAGFALTSGKRGVVGSATVAVDMDLTKAEGVGGDERFLAVGAEAWAPQNSLGVRGGFRKNTMGAGETMLSGGVSVAVRKSTFVDVYATTGDNVRHGWGLALRVTF